jgi:hypothetical protein
MVVMVVGGNGQLGALCVDELRRRGQEVRATVRDRARAGRLEKAGAEVVLLDITDPTQRRMALEGVDALILSANAVAPVQVTIRRPSTQGCQHSSRRRCRVVAHAPSCCRPCRRVRGINGSRRCSLSAISRTSCSTDRRRAGCCGCRPLWSRGLLSWDRRCRCVVSRMPPSGDHRPS